VNICAITSVDIIICLVWALTDPMQWTRKVLDVDKFGVSLGYKGYCTSDHWKGFALTIAGWHFLLLGMALWLCYVSRNISSQYAEAKSLSIVMISQSQIFLIGIPVLFLVGDDSDSSFFVRSAVIWLNDFGVILIIFGNLMYTVHWNKTENLEVGDAVKNFRELEEQARISNFTKCGGACDDDIIITAQDTRRIGRRRSTK